MLPPATPQASMLTLSDSRRLAYVRYGADNGTPVLYLHGLPGSRLECQLIEKPARDLGISVIAIDRPGYGATTPLTSHSLLTWTADVEQLADHLGWSQFAIIGYSGGGPCALACAHHLAGRVSRVALIAPLGPVYERPMMLGMGHLARASFFMARRAPGILKLVAGYPLTLLAQRRPRLLIDILAVLNGQPDRACLQHPQAYHAFSRSLPICFAQGSRGALDDLRRFQQPWAVPFEKITVPVRLWHGDRDRVVPIGHSERLAERLANADLEAMPGEGHFSLPLLHMQSLLYDFMTDRTGPN